MGMGQFRYIHFVNGSWLAYLRCCIENKPRFVVGIQGFGICFGRMLWIVMGVVGGLFGRCTCVFHTVLDVVLFVVYCCLDICSQVLCSYCFVCRLRLCVKHKSMFYTFPCCTTLPY